MYNNLKVSHQHFDETCPHDPYICLTCLSDLRMLLLLSSYGLSSGLNSGQHVHAQEGGCGGDGAYDDGHVHDHVISSLLKESI